ncbi:hypothetical protein HDU98_008274 [Podochytrium sp. JEL0797]|nr:hypothetical protein HDU98_008274 [Podochytrium sp. JEL0797]
MNPFSQTCVSFNSPEGKKLFKEALARGTAESFLHLSGNLIHQSEPAYCGLASLAIVLNALEVDPNRSWKGPWRWYDETLLDCCSPLETIKKKGITLDQFTCLARCNGLNVQQKQVSQVNPRVTKQEFIEDLKRVCSDSEGREQMVVSYSRKVLKQTGDGHFSPVGCFHEESGMVLVLDVARFKYPSYFVHVDVLYEALKPLDKETGESRGYFVLEQKRGVDCDGGCGPCCAGVTEAEVLTKVMPLSLSNGEGGVGQALNQQLACALEVEGATRGSVIRDVVSILVGEVAPSSRRVASVASVRDSEGVLSLSLRKRAVDLAAEESQDVLEMQEKSHAEQIDAFLAQVEAMPMYQQVVDAFSECSRIVTPQKTALFALLMVSLPVVVYSAIRDGEVRRYFVEAKKAVWEGSGSQVKNEAKRMDEQLTNLMEQNKCGSKCSKCV